MGQARFWRGLPPLSYVVLLMRPSLLFCVLAVPLSLCLARPAAANTVAAPAAGKAILVPFGRALCSFEGDAHGWRIGVGNRHLLPPPVPGRAQVKVADSMAACQGEGELVDAVAYGALPEVAGDGFIVHVDGGRVEVTGKRLGNSALIWQVGGAQGADTCHEAESKEGTERCTYAVPDSWPADPTLLQMAVVPDGLKLSTDVAAFDAKGRRQSLSGLLRAPGRIVVRDLLASDAAVDVETEESRLTLNHREAIAQAVCTDALCEWNQRELVVRSLRGNEDALEVRVTLKPHVFLANKAGLSSVTGLWVPLQRCPLSLASAPPLRGPSSQKIVLKVGGRCAQDDSLRFVVNGTTAQVVDRLTISGNQYLVVSVDTSLGDEVSIGLQRRTRVVAQLRQKTRQMPNVRARLELAGHGAIDFLPTNRDADLLLPMIGEGSILMPLPVAGVYTVTDERPGSAKVRGVLGATGWVALRFAVRDTRLPGALAQLNLVQFSETVDRNLHSASLPVSLGASALGTAPVVELFCSDGVHENRTMTPAKPINLPFAVRDSCRLVLHRERLLPEEGDQLFRITVQVADLAGVNRTEAGIDQRIKLSPGKEPRVLYISGVMAPFDRVVVRATVITEDLPEAVLAERFNEQLRLPQVQWSLTMGNSRLRLFATTSMPTGLFRVADEAHSGLMGLSAGVLMRLVYLTRNGTQMPLGLEAGVFVVGITGDTTPAPHGQTAAVGGLSLSVPIANVSRSTQAAINLHAWAEYEISRRFIANSGSPWGFIFGPSLSFGDVGWNL